MFSHLRAVVLVHPDEQVRRRWAEALQGASLRSAATPEAATELLADEAGVVLAPPGEAPRLVAALERAGFRGQTFFVLPEGSTGAPELEALWAQGKSFSQVDEAELSGQMRAQLSRQHAPRSSPRHPASEALVAKVSVAGQTLWLRCADISTDGLGLVTGPDAPVERLLPGTQLEGVELQREGVRVLGPVRAEVRQLQHVGWADPPLFHLGLAFRPPVPEGQLPAPDEERHPAKVATLLMRGLRRKSAFRLETPRSPAQMEPLPGLCRAWPGRPLLLCRPLQRFQEGDVVELAFSLGHDLYRGLVSVGRATSEGQELPFPRALTRRRLEAGHGLVPSQGHPFSVSFLSPLTGRICRGAVLEVQPTGLRFEAEDGGEALPPRLMLEPLSVVLPDGSLASAPAWVESSVKTAPSRPGALPALVSTVGMKQLPEGVLRWVAQSRASAQGEGFGEGAFAHSAPSAELWERFSGTAGALGRRFYFADGARERAHAVGLRLYPHTWVVDHQLSLDGGDQGRAALDSVCALCFEAAELLPDIEYGRYVWDLGHPVTRRFVGLVSRFLQREGLTSLLSCQQLNGMPEAQDHRPILPVRPASAADLGLLERYFRSRGDLVRLRSEELTVGGLELSGLSARWAACGFERSRTVLVADGEDGPLAFGWLERMTPGLSARELGNGLQLVVPDPRRPGTGQAVQSVVATCVEAARGGPLQAFCDDALAPLLEGMGFARSRRLAVFTFHRSLAASWHNLTRGMAGRYGAGDV